MSTKTREIQHGDILIAIKNFHVNKAGDALLVVYNSKKELVIHSLRLGRTTNWYVLPDELGCEYVFKEDVTPLQKELIDLNSIGYR